MNLDAFERLHTILPIYKSSKSPDNESGRDLVGPGNLVTVDCGDLTMEEAMVLAQSVDTAALVADLDASKRRLKFRLLQPGGPVKELHHCVLSMRVGESAVFYVEETKACFHLTLISADRAQKVTEDGKVTKIILQKGQGATRPNEDAEVVARFVGRWSDAKEGSSPALESKEFEVLTLGTETCAQRIPWGVEEALKNMYQGEHALVTINAPEFLPLRSDSVVQDEVKQLDESEDEKSQPASLTVDLELREFRKGLESWQTDLAGKISMMKYRKEQGNFHFKRAAYLRAMGQYEAALRLFTYDDHLDADQRNAVDLLRAACYANLAACRMKKGEYMRAIQTCGECLKYDPNHVKSLFRRGECYALLGESARAEADLKRANELAPGNKSVRAWLVSVRKQLKNESKKEREMYAGIFDRLESHEVQREETISYDLKTLQKIEPEPVATEIEET